MEFDPTQTIFSTLGTAIVALLAASLSYLVGISTKRQEWQLALRKEYIDRYRKLSADFLTEFNKLTLMSLETRLRTHSSPCVYDRNNSDCSKEIDG